MDFAPSRRTFISGLAATSLTALIASSPARAATTVSITQFGGSPSNPDNATALSNAITAAGYAGVVTIPAATFPMRSPVTAMNRVTLAGASPTTSRFAWANGTSAYGLDFNLAASGSLVRGIGMYGPSSAIVRAMNGQNVALTAPTVTLDACEFYEPKQYAVQTEDNAWMRIQGPCRFIGQADGTGQAGAIGPKSIFEAMPGTKVSGLHIGFYGVAAKRMSVNNVEFDGMWFNGKRLFAASAAAVSATSMRLSGSTDIMGVLGLGSINPIARPTVVAWSKVTSSATITPVAGSPGTYTASGFAPESRMMLTVGVADGIITSVSGTRFTVANWNTTTTRYPRTAPGTSSGVIVERPYIARLVSASGSNATVDRWRAGVTAATKTPPVGARVQINRAVGYQCFATNGTLDYEVKNSTVLRSWCDSISSIGVRNATVTGNTVYDGQDTGVTVEMNTGSCLVQYNTFYRSGTASVFCAVENAVVDGNISYGAQYMADGDDSYGAFSMQGSANAKYTNNRAVRVGAPFENRAFLIDGRFGQHKTDVVAPFATNVLFSGNTYSGYPKYDVTMRGTHATVSRASTWQAGTRFEVTAGATMAMLGR